MLEFDLPLVVRLPEIELSAVRPQLSISGNGIMSVWLLRFTFLYFTTIPTLPPIGIRSQLIVRIKVRKRSNTARG